jgi:ribonuclease HII
MPRTYFKQIEKRLPFECVVGVDEVGRGSLAGPMVVGLTVYSDYLKTLKGLNDSKKMTDRCRRSLASRINGVAAVVWPYEIDEFGLTLATEKAIRRGLKMLKLQGYNPDCMLMDGKIGFDIEGIECQCFVGGDSFIRSIAASSVLAKVYRDNMMQLYSGLYRDYAFEDNVGYGTRVHRSAILKSGSVRIHRKRFLEKIYASK